MNEYFVYYLIIIGFIFIQTTENIELINLNNRTLLVATIFEEPFMMLKKYHNNTINETNISHGTIIDPSLVEGYCADLVHIICYDKLKLSYKFLIETKYGREIQKGVWNGIIGTLINRNADMSVAPLTITEARENVVDFSKPFMDVGISIMIRKLQQQKSGTLSLIPLRSIEIGFCIIIFYLVVRLYLFLISRSSSYLCRFESKIDGVQQNTLSMQDTLFLSLSVFLYQNAKILPRSLSDHMKKSAWCGFAIIILLLCATHLITFLRYERIPKHIETVEDLAKQVEIRYGTVRNSSTMTFFNASTLKIFKDMWNFMEQHKDDVFVASNREGIEKVRQSNGKYAFLTGSAFIDYVNGRLPCETMRLDGIFNIQSYGIATPLGSDLREAIGKTVSELKQNGLLTFLQRKWFYDTSECRNFGRKDSKHKIISTLIYIGTIFYILIMNICIVIIITVFEFLFKAKKRSNQLN